MFGFYSKFASKVTDVSICINDLGLPKNQHFFICMNMIIM